MLKPLKHVQDLLAENAELLARLKLADDQSRRLQQENERLQGLKPENTRLNERVMLLEEEVRWFKEQFFGRSSQKSTSEMSTEQRMLFNEAEVLSVNGRSIFPRCGRREFPTPDLITSCPIVFDPAPVSRTSESW